MARRIPRSASGVLAARWSKVLLRGKYQKSVIGISRVCIDLSGGARLTADLPRRRRFSSQCGEIGSRCSLRIRRYVAAGPPPRRRCFEGTPATVLSAGMDTPS
ncbi:hypothetical protein F2Q70_00013446 [Brassica cretica]|uniref:Uncharacterized protein n=1 Tax=Brassica cretica TaxID=69181 RepID=A0A8S9M3U9_BRACR|nr:hypothetical protein F2Q70_00013446 [Brassica cretica]